MKLPAGVFCTYPGRCLCGTPKLPPRIMKRWQQNVKNSRNGQGDQPLHASKKRARSTRARKSPRVR